MESRRVMTSRRSLLTALSLGGLSGCVGTVSHDTDSVSVLAAGSLYNALEHGMHRPTSSLVEIEAHGSVQVARMIASGQKSPDIIVVADRSLLNSILDPAWYATFATNAIVLAYDPQSVGGRAIRESGATEWFEPLLDGTATLGRTDPDLDPLGYRTLFTLDLATAHYGLSTNLRVEIPAQNQIYPETQLLGQFETGSIDVAFVYRNMAIERGYEFLDLPSEIDLSDPTKTTQYAHSQYTLPDGRTIAGDLISYATTARTMHRDVMTVFDELHTGDYLTDYGFTVPETYPTYTSDAPNELTN